MISCPNGMQRFQGPHNRSGPLLALVAISGLRLHLAGKLFTALLVLEPSGEISELLPRLKVLGALGPSNAPLDGRWPAAVQVKCCTRPSPCLPDVADCFW
mmetsp:Transcript_58674/g.155167  ORF Transcript_58674/g.155167 Transcript_58674/m.155167 type:complete len:100 (-) Transcript_58674:291-590(-)